MTDASGLQVRWRRNGACEVVVTLPDGKTVEYLISDPTEYGIIVEPSAGHPEERMALMVSPTGRGPTSRQLLARNSE